MKFPNKVITYKESVLSKFPIILEELKKHSLSVNELYQKEKNRFQNIKEFTDVLSCLYALQKIVINESNGRLEYVV